MHKILSLLALVLVFISCGMSTERNTSEPQVQNEMNVNNRVEVLYFHGKQRCATCLAIEHNVREAVENSFAEQLKNGKVMFKMIDLSKKENEQIAEKYEVTWSSLFAVKYKDGKETSKNLTEFAFGNARKSPETFKEEIVRNIHEMLK